MVLWASENASRTPGGCFWHRMRIPYRRRLFLVPSAFEGAGEGPAGDKFRVNGTQEMAEGAGANKESGVLSEANCCRSDCFFGCLYQESRESRSHYAWRKEKLLVRLGECDEEVEVT